MDGNITLILHHGGRFTPRASDGKVEYIGREFDVWEDIYVDYMTTFILCDLVQAYGDILYLVKDALENENEINVYFHHEVDPIPEEVPLMLDLKCHPIPEASNEDDLDDVPVAGHEEDVGGGEKGINVDVGGDEERDVGGDEGEKEVEVEFETDGYHSEELKNPINSDDEDEDVDKVYPQYKESSRLGEEKLELGMEFGTLAEFKSALREYSIFMGREFKWKKNDKQRARAKCKKACCDWEIYCAKNEHRNCFKIKSFKHEHKCCREIKNKQANREWVVSKLEAKLKIQPSLKCVEASNYFKQEFGVHIEVTKMWKAMKEAKPFIGLDGCFLKSAFGGNLLSIVGVDANIHIFAIAYAVVDVENKDNWKWFLTLLHEDLGDYVQNGWNFMSDMQKGIITALQEVMPGAPHRFCALHLWKNFTKQWKSKELKGIVWQCAKSTIVAEFEGHMAHLKTINWQAWEYLNKWLKEAWTKAHFSIIPKVDNICKNTCEVFNAKILQYRCKPILTMLEEIRCYIMRTMAAHKVKLSGKPGPLHPVQYKRLEKEILFANQWTPIWCGDNMGVRYEDDDLLAQDKQALNEAEEAAAHVQEGPVEINLSQPNLSQDSDMEFMVPASIVDVPPVARYKLNITRPKQKNISHTSTVDAPVVDGPPTTPLFYMPTPRFTGRKAADKDPV
ncbi:hypothetical protein HKD37_15G042996 [Glycine soja]